VGRASAGTAKLRLDENLGRSVRDEPAGGGYEVATRAIARQRHRQRLDRGVPRRRACTGDVGSGFRKPAPIAARALPGIAVFRPPPQISAEILRALVKTLAGALEKERLAGHLWIIEVGRIRAHEASDDG